MPQPPIYLDNNATTKPDPRVVEAMLPYLRDIYGNAASRSHSFGWAAEEAVEKARGQVAALIGADPREIVWTSGATESDNLALKGVAEAYADRGDHLVTAATEHKAVLDAARHLERQGKRVTVLPVDRHGIVDLDALRDSLTERTVLVSVMLANNEIGTLAPMADDQPPVPRAGHSAPHGRHPGGRQGAGGCRGAGGGSAVPDGAQDVRAEGRRRAVRPASEPACPAGGADGRRRARARLSVGDAERAGHRRLRPGGGTVPPGTGARCGPRPISAGQTARRHLRQGWTG